MTELDQERQLSPLPPVVAGGALVIPHGLLERLRGERTPDAPALHARETETGRADRRRGGARSRARDSGAIPEEKPRNNPGYDILSDACRRRPPRSSSR